ncbi:MAG: T9SS C-terminal target domain-containing protein, partial [Bacteroidetes bacterium]
ASELRYRVVADGQHSEWFWAREFEDAYRFLFRTAGTNALDPLSPLSQVSVYPNPALDRVTVETPIAVTLTLLDVSGREVFTRKVAPGKQALELPLLTRGVYLLRMESGSAIRTQRIVKE